MTKGHNSAEFDCSPNVFLYDHLHIKVISAVNVCTKSGKRLKRSKHKKRFELYSIVENNNKLTKLFKK